MMASEQPHRDSNGHAGRWLPSLRATASRLPGAILWAVDGQGDCCVWEGLGLSALASKTDELVGKNVLALWASESIASLVSRARTGEAVRERVELFGGRHFDGWAFAEASERGEPVVAFFGVDVTASVLEEIDQKERVEVLEWQAVALSSFGKALERASVLLWAVDTAGVFTMASGKALELFGSHGADIVGANAVDRFGNTNFGEGISMALAGLESRNVVEPVANVYLDTWFLPITDPLTNDPAGVIGLSVDVGSLVLKERELAHQLSVVEEQGKTIRALATPVISVWDGVLCLPVVGAVDEERAQSMMTDLLEAVIREKARYVVLDMTGATGVNESTGSHLLKVLQAARVLGTEGILCGLRPDMARTVALMEIGFVGVATFRTLKDALRHCIARLHR